MISAMVGALLCIAWPSGLQGGVGDGVRSSSMANELVV